MDVIALALVIVVAAAGGALAGVALVFAYARSRFPMLWPIVRDRARAELIARRAKVRARYHRVGW